MVHTCISNCYMHTSLRLIWDTSTPLPGLGGGGTDMMLLYDGGSITGGLLYAY